MTKQPANPCARPLVNLYHKVVNFHKTTRNLLRFLVERSESGLAQSFSRCLRRHFLLLLKNNKPAANEPQNKNGELRLSPNQIRVRDGTLPHAHFPFQQDAFSITNTSIFKLEPITFDENCLNMRLKRFKNRIATCCFRAAT